MSISSTGLYGSATIVNTDIFDDVQAFKEENVTLSISYLTTTQEHRDDISQNRQDISSNWSKITDISNNRITAIEQDITDISNNEDEENEFDSKEFKEEHEKIHRDAVEYTTPIIKALNGLPVYYRYHIKNGLALGKGLKIVRYQDFTKKRNHCQKRKEKKRKEIKKKEEDVEDELANQFNDTMNISTKRRRVDDV